MRNKYVTWTLALTVLFSSFLFAEGPLKPAQAAGGTNLALGKNVTASGQTQTYGPNNVKDSNQSTYWESTNNAFPQWIQVDLGTASSIDQIILKLPAGWGTRTQTLAVQGSTDGSSFTNIVGSAGYVFDPAVSNNTVTINFSAASTRYVRLNVTANTAWPAAQLSELKIYGTGSTTTPPTTPAGTYEAEAASLSGGAKVNTDHIGYTGTGFVDGYWLQGATTAFTVNTSAAGNYDVTLKYANATGSAKTVSVYVNGMKIRQTTLANLANWDTWGTKAETLSLNAGSNTIVYKYDANDSGNVNLDCITVAPSTSNPQPPDPDPNPPVTTPTGRGASFPYSRYDTQDATRGGGATLQSAPTFNQAQTASEASGQSYIALPANGSYAQWTVRQGQGGAGVTMRFTMPDSADGMGLNGSLDVYVNGVKVKTVSLTSYYSWQYFSGDMPGDAPSAGRPLFRFDEVHWKLDTPLQPGDTIKIQKGNGDTLEYGVDFLEIEPVPTAVAQPANSLSVTNYGAVANDGQDDLAAFKATVTAAVAAGKSVYIPAGTFNLSNMWEIGSANNMINNITITGAGFWYTNIQFTNPNAAGGGISLRISGQLDFSNVYMNSNLRSRYGQNAIYKGFMDNFGTNSKIHDVWVEHFECGMWVGDYAHTPAIYATGLVVENSRIRNNLADGINFSQGTSNSTVRNSSIRNNGDDGLAVWPSNTNGAPAGVNNTFSYNTIENNWRAGGIAFFGGSGHKADHNLITDIVGGSGIRMNTVFPGYHFQNNTGITFSDTTIINSGTSQDLYNGERGAIDLEASNDAIRNVTFSNIDIINTQRDAIQFGYGGGFQNIVFNNININGTGLDGITTSRFSGPHKGAAIYTYTGNGSATFNNLTTSNIAYPGLNYIQQGFNLTIN
ncbi:discoidin domain-containing protein [Paenibacillus kobensis]|uniref:discoidin domain-containing protein n=1 Tax=Paenibacillus kobensis TaxID=59841 RepID=UPI000FD9C819|nr:discoidin domain-containing protein [Paenibacillus kobensis]